MSLPANTWELDFYSRPLLDENGKKRWEALICSSDGSFQWQRFCPADSVNSIWLKTALSDALAAADEARSPAPRRVRRWRACPSPLYSSCASTCTPTSCSGRWQEPRRAMSSHRV